jgi:hypothetical protein
MQDVLPKVKIVTAMRGALVPYATHRDEPFKKNGLPKVKES